MGQGDIYMAVVLYLVFTGICTVGAYLIGANFKSRRAGLIAAISTVAFFVLLFAGLTALVRTV